MTLTRVDPFDRDFDDFVIDFLLRPSSTSAKKSDARVDNSFWNSGSVAVTTAAIRDVGNEFWRLRLPHVQQHGGQQFRRPIAKSLHRSRAHPSLYRNRRLGANFLRIDQFYGTRTDQFIEDSARWNTTTKLAGQRFKCNSSSVHMELGWLPIGPGEFGILVPSGQNAIGRLLLSVAVPFVGA